MIWVAQKNDLAFALKELKLDSILLFQYLLVCFLSDWDPAVAVDVHLLSLMFSSYAFQRFIHSFFIFNFDSPLNLWLYVFFKAVVRDGRVGFPGRSLSVCFQSVRFMFLGHSRSRKCFSPRLLSCYSAVAALTLVLSQFSLRCGADLQKHMQWCCTGASERFISLQNQKKNVFDRQ